MTGGLLAELAAPASSAAWNSASSAGVAPTSGLASPPLTVTVPAIPGPVISAAGVVQAYEPWAVWVLATGLQWSDRIRFYDVGGAPWGPDQSIVLASDGSGMSTQLPSDSPPSHCNQTTSCDIQFAIIDPGSGQPITPRRTLTIPH